jgi:hypothetical protein
MGQQYYKINGCLSRNDQPSETELLFLKIKEILWLDIERLLCLFCWFLLHPKDILRQKKIPWLLKQLLITPNKQGRCIWYGILTAGTCQINDTGKKTAIQSGTWFGLR